MNEPLKIGDLAQVIGTHCGVNEWLGHIFEVKGFETGSGWCYYCRGKIGHGTYPVDEHGRAWFYAKRIPPLGELDDVKREEEITA